MKGDLAGLDDSIPPLLDPEMNESMPTGLRGAAQSQTMLAAFAGRFSGCLQSVDQV